MNLHEIPRRLRLAWLFREEATAVCRPSCDRTTPVADQRRSSLGVIFARENMPSCAPSSDIFTRRKSEPQVAMAKRQKLPCKERKARGFYSDLQRTNASTFFCIEKRNIRR
ncbi:unnamed protein product [Amoebophrya sp. A120]|nr:unnamed protein product [Amoebophrya sp. A120]|eukprot:GSA120T00011793001.1